MSAPLRVLMVGGGTGGHVIPALAIAEELKQRFAAEVRFVGTSRGIEVRLVPAAGYPLELIQVGALKNVTLATRVKTLLDLPKALFRCLKNIRSFKPGVVVGVGGYASGPGMMAAILSHVPTLAFEPNVVPGFANRMVATLVSAAAIHFRESAKYFRNPTVTGVPVRADFFQLPPKTEGGSPSLLIFGGSQGARAINRVMPQTARSLIVNFPNLRIVHQAGERDFDETQSAYREVGIQAEVRRFIVDMAHAFAQADVLVCRSGASTVAEVAAAGKTAVFVPFPHAADDHQTRNAKVFAQKRAAVLVAENELTAERLAKVLGGFFQNRELLSEVGENARSLAHPDAAAQIAALVQRIARPS